MEFYLPVQVQVIAVSVCAGLGVSGVIFSDVSDSVVVTGSLDPRASPMVPSSPTSLVSPGGFPFGCPR